MRSCFRQVAGQPHRVRVGWGEIDRFVARHDPRFAPFGQVQKPVGAGVFLVALMDDEAEQVGTRLQRDVPVDAEIVGAGGLEARFPGDALARIFPDVQRPAVVNAVRTPVVNTGRALRGSTLSKSVSHADQA